jgi:DNA-binding XRE family transcriptional regulator
MGAVKPVTMTVNQFKKAGEKLYGDKWQAPLARTFGMSPQAINAIAQGRTKRIKPIMAMAMYYLVLKTDLEQPQVATKR